MGSIVAFLLLAVIAVSIIFSYEPILRNAQQLTEMEQAEIEEIQNNEKNNFVKELLKGTYCLYWEAVNVREDSYILPSKVFLKQGGIDSEFNEVLEKWYEEFFSDVIYRYGLDYYILDHSTRKSITSTNDMLSSLLKNSEKSYELRENVSFYMVLNYGKNGIIEVTQFSGLENTYISDFLTMAMDKTLFLEEGVFYGENGEQIGFPTDVTIVFASYDDSLFDNGGENLQEHYQKMGFSRSGFSYVYWTAIIIVILLGLMLPLKKSWRIGERIAVKIPFEIISLLLLFVIMWYDNLAYMAMDTARGTIFNTEFSMFPDWVSQILIYVLNFTIWMIVLSIWLIAIVSYRQIFTIGIKKYLFEKTIFFKIAASIMKHIKMFFYSLKKIDLTDSTNKYIIKILLVNFVVLSIFCSIWFLGIVGLIVYSYALFFMIKKYIKQTKENYTVLVDVTSKVAQGNLEISIEEDLGIFEPLKQELSKIQFGFKKAVEEEMKSQKMKTELITNVSHDLKTPLTAIITYIDLLKEQNLSKEEIESYIDTIDKKSRRLKILIEDLFEISKASSNNVVLNLIELDLTALLKQVLLELDDKINESEIEFRTNIPKEKVLLNLDSDKTYRIFENLIINISKYAMPHTRAYIDIIMKEDTVTITLKNISAEELVFHPDDITDRFVRGDQSRHTEGSGLGLAIVKSFVELQKGSFQILIDGDLFKTVIEWKRT